MRVRSLSQEDTMEEGIATPTVFLPGESHGLRSLAGYSPWGRHDWNDLAHIPNYIRFRPDLNQICSYCELRKSCISWHCKVYGWGHRSQGLSSNTESWIQSAHWGFLLFSHSVMSNSLWPRGLQHARLPCPSPSPGVFSNSCPLSQWCHSTISSSVFPFSSCLQSFPASGSFPTSQSFASHGQSVGASASASVLPMHIQDWGTELN